MEQVDSVLADGVLPAEGCERVGPMGGITGIGPAQQLVGNGRQQNILEHGCPVSFHMAKSRFDPLAGSHCHVVLSDGWVITQPLGVWGHLNEKGVPHKTGG